MGYLVDHPLHIARHNPIMSTDQPTDYYAVVLTGYPTKMLELWRWQQPSRDYEVIMTVDPASALLFGDDGISISDGPNRQFCGGYEDGPYIWNGLLLERLDPSEWHIYSCASARFEHLVGAPTRYQPGRTLIAA